MKNNIKKIKVKKTIKKMEKNSYESSKIMNYLYEKDYENKVCVHCTNSLPKFVSINNSILICSTCYLKHLSLGYNISYVRAIGDDWDPYLLSFLERGGNSRFKRLIKKYNLEKIPFEKLFLIRILEYYRLLIKSEVLADEPPNEIDNKSLLDNIDVNINYFPEFENYKIFQGKNILQYNNHSNLINLFRLIGSGAYYIHHKLDENEIYKKSFNNTIYLLNGVKEGGKILYKTTKPVFKYLSIKTIQGIGYLCRKVIDELDDNKNNNNNTNNTYNENNNCNIDVNDFFNVNNYVITPNLDFPTFEEIMMANESENYNNCNNNQNIIVFDNNDNYGNLLINNEQNENNKYNEQEKSILQKKDSNDISPMMEINTFIQEDNNS